ncbi:MAG: NRDE family protein [Anditalea sp.]
MCTVTYLPVKPTLHFITSSRDEHLLRPAALPPKIYKERGRALLFPQDPVGHGTWMAASSGGAVCLLNGAFVPHQRKNTYKHSRGLVPLHFFEFDSVNQFAGHYAFEGIEPFTLIIVQEGQLHELKWDEARVHLKKLPAGRPHIWASVTLYTPQVIRSRKRWFKKWLDTSTYPDAKEILHFHKYYGEADRENGLVIERSSGLKTISITSLKRTDISTTMIHEDLINRSINEAVL